MAPKQQRIRHLTDSRDVAEIAKGIETMIAAFSEASRESFVAATDWGSRTAARDAHAMPPRPQRIRHRWTHAMPPRSRRGLKR